MNKVYGDSGADMGSLQHPSTPKALGHEADNSSPKHTHSNPFNSECPACKLVCLYCIGRKQVLTTDTSVEYSGYWYESCYWCNGEGTRKAYNRGNRRHQEQLNDLQLNDPEADTTVNSNAPNNNNLPKQDLNNGLRKSH